MLVLMCGVSVIPHKSGILTYILLLWGSRKHAAQTTHATQRGLREIGVGGCFK